ncbi:MAG TPA: hypothetical protein VH164_18015 [Ktedonobacteraceae bacterium]|jgi:hypothetical protein|nr:hypothetical protein [Ktedonobacteraceae bacterium]
MDEMTDDRPQWEHYIEYINADARDSQTKDFLATYYPGAKFSKYAAEATVRRLNEIGEQGWELVHMQPIWLNNDGTVTSATGIGTNTYFCVFKRPKRSAWK